MTPPAPQRPLADPALGMWQGVGPRWLLDRFRRLMRRTNPGVVRALGGRVGPYAIVHHVGRRSVRAYTTPVVAFARGGRLFLPLPYSWDVDWVRNLQAAGGGRLTWKHRTFSVGAPSVLAAADVLPRLSPFIRLGCRAIGVRQFLELPPAHP